MSECTGSLRKTPQSPHLWTLTRYVQNPHSRQKALWCVLTPTILAEYQQNLDQILIFQEENKNGESGSHLLPSKDDVKKVVGSEARKTKLSTIYSLSSGKGGDWCAQQAEDGEGWERRCRQWGWRRRRSWDGKGGEKVTQGATDHKNHESCCICINYPLN